MSSIPQPVHDVPGHFRVGGLNFYVAVPSNKPYCHFCQKRVRMIAVIVNATPGNPKHICEACLAEITGGFEAIKNEFTEKENRQTEAQ